MLDVELETIESSPVELSFYRFIDCVIAGLTQQFELARNPCINNSFSCLRLFRELSEADVENACLDFCKEYDKDASRDLTDEVKFLKRICEIRNKTETE